MLKTHAQAAVKIHGRSVDIWEGIGPGKEVGEDEKFGRDIVSKRQGKQHGLTREIQRLR